MRRIEGIKDMRVCEVRERREGRKGKNIKKNRKEQVLGDGSVIEQRAW